MQPHVLPTSVLIVLCDSKSKMREFLAILNEQTRGKSSFRCVPKTQHRQSIHSTFNVTYAAQILVVPYCTRANAKRVNFLCSHKKLDLC